MRFSSQESRGRIHVMSLGRSAPVEQPARGVHRGLAAADDHIAGRWLVDVVELADGHARTPSATSNGGGSVAGTREAM